MPVKPRSTVNCAAGRIAHGGTVGLMGVEADAWRRLPHVVNSELMFAPPAVTHQDSAFACTADCPTVSAQLSSPFRADSHALCSVSPRPGPVDIPVGPVKMPPTPRAITLSARGEPWDAGPSQRRQSNRVWPWARVTVGHGSLGFGAAAGQGPAALPRLCISHRRAGRQEEDARLPSRGDETRPARGMPVLNPNCTLEGPHHAYHQERQHHHGSRRPRPRHRDQDGAHDR
jgi:hypothetical protein